jgi:hypothetical protein
MDRHATLLLAGLLFLLFCLLLALLACFLGIYPLPRQLLKLGSAMLLCFLSHVRLD